MTNLMTLSNQWASRPDDQRFLSLDDLHNKVLSRKNSSRVHDVALEHVRVAATESGDLVLGNTEGETYGSMTHWTMGQMSIRAGAPAGYLRTLPPDMAAMNLQWSLEHADREDGKILTRVNGETHVAAVTSPTYGRVWDAELTGAIKARIDPTVWKVPGASYAAKDPKRATTLYASDRDVFLFLCDETHPIEVPGEAPKFRGFYAWNSETGNGRCGIATMLYDRVCDNRIIWGVSEFREWAIRHTSGAPMRFVSEAVPQLRKYIEASTVSEVKTIQAAQDRVVGKDRASVLEWMRSRGFAKGTSAKAYDAAEKEGIRNPRSLWGVVSGLTDVAHNIAHTDERVDLERKASELLDLVAE